MSNRAFAAGLFELQIDGHKTTAYLKAVEGGQVKHQVTEERSGMSHQPIKSLSGVREVEPMTLDFGLSGAKEVLKWIQGSWNRDWARRNGMITHANFALKPTLTQEFHEALIIETVFPALDGNSKDAGYLKIKVQPEWVTETKLPGTGSQISGLEGGKQKQWITSMFRLHIDGLDDEEMKFVNHIDSFTIKQGVKKLYTGQAKLPEIEPTKIEFPNITGTIALAHAGGLMKWHEQTTGMGANDVKAQKHGAIEFLTPDGKKTIFKVQLYEMALTSLSVAASTANADQIKRVKFDLFVGRMDIDGDGIGLD